MNVNYFKQFWKSSLMVIMLCFGLTSWGQTNPTPHNLADSNFTMMSVPTGTSYPTSTQGWTIGPNSYLTTASTAAPSGDKALTNNDNASTYGMFNRTTNGIGFRQSNSNRNVGAFVVAINTIGVSNVEVQYFLTAAYPTDRIAGIQAQYRIGTTGDFINLGTTKESDNFSEIAYIETLPESCEDQEVIQVRWVYFDIGTSGGRTGVSIDDITISSTPSDPTQVATPTISATGTANGTDTYWDSAEITLETTTPDATIYYTVDDGATLEYVSPFTITSTSTIEAYAEADGLDDSEIATKTITITYTVPTITASTESITGLGYEFGSPTSTAQSFNLTGANLDGAGDVIIALDEGVNSDFEISLDDNTYDYELSIENFANGSTPIYVRLKSGLAISADYIDNITILNDYNSDELNILVEGAVTPPAPTTTVSETALSGFTYVLDNGPSSEQSFTVEGSYLTSDITVTAPTNYQVSLSSGSGFQNSVTLTQTDGTVAETTVYVQLNAGLGVNNYNGDITVTATDVANKTIALTGSVTCGASALPYSEDFESVTTPNVPNCTTVVQGGSGNLWTTSSPNESGFTSKALTYQWHNDNDGDTWFFTNGLQLEGGQSYRLSFRYGNNSASYSENLRVAYGTSNSIAAMTTELADYPNINDNTPHSVTINFEPATTGTYYIGFHAYSESDNYRLYVDDILVEENVPTISVEPATVPAFTAVTDGSDSEDIIITGILLSDNIDIALSGTNADQFSLSATSLDSVGGTLTVTYEPTTVGDHNATLTLSSTDATDVVLTLNGTATLGVPVATAATAIGSDSFTANWEAVAGAESYEIEVKTMSMAPVSDTEEFENGLDTSGYETGWEANLIGGTWILDNVLRATNTNAYSGTYSAQLRAADGKLTSPEFNKPISISFYAKSSNNNFNISKKIDGVTTLIETVAISSSFDIYTVNINEASENVQIIIEATGGSAAYLDQLTINYYDVTNTSISGSPFTISAPETSYEVTGLDPETTYYYVVRAVAEAEISVNSNEIEVTTLETPAAIVWTTENVWSNVDGPTITDDAIIEGELTLSGNLSAKTLTVAEGGKITVPANMVLTVDEAIINEAGAANFVVENDGILIQNTDTENTGAITVERNSNPMRRLEYTLWSSPVTGQNLQAFSPATLPNRIYELTETESVLGWTSVADPSATNFEPGKGYFFRSPNNYDPVNQQVFEGQFVGIPNNGDVDIMASYEFNGIGNPYPSPIDADEFILANDINALYFWTNNNAPVEGSYNTVNNWATYVVGSGTTAQGGGLMPDGIIQSGQGFIVGFVPGDQGNINFNNAMRVAENGQFFKPMSSEKHRIWLNLSNEEVVFNQILVGYIENATQGVDTGMDAKMFGYDGNALYSIIDNSNENYVIQARKLPFTASDVVALGFRAVNAGSFTISLNNVDGLFADNQNIYLKDNFTQAVHNLKDGAYTFVSEEGIFDTRFEVVYQTTMSTENPVANNANWVVYSQENGFQIQTQGFELKSVQVFDLLGRAIYTANAEGTAHSIPSLGADSVYIVKVTTTENIVLSKKVR
jgi:hypothetical protein